MSKKKFLGEKIAFHRDKLGLNRKEFTERLNELLGTKYTTQALYSWEKSVSIPPADIVPPLAHLLEMNILELFGVEVSSLEDLVKNNEELVAELEKLKKIVNTQEADIQRLTGKVEASESFVDKLMTQLRENKNDTIDK